MTITMIPETFSADVDFTSTRLARPTNRAGVVANSSDVRGADAAPVRAHTATARRRRADVDHVPAHLPLCVRWGDRNG